jgi:hypothetical protein
MQPLQDLLKLWGRQRPRYAALVCRSIKTLRRREEPASPEEIEAAARQFVRKVSGFQRPSRANEDVFEEAIEEIAASSRRLLDSLVVPGGGARLSAEAAGRE